MGNKASSGASPAALLYAAAARGDARTVRGLLAPADRSQTGSSQSQSGQCEQTVGVDSGVINARVGPGHDVTEDYGCDGDGGDGGERRKQHRLEREQERKTAVGEGGDGDGGTGNELEGVEAGHQGGAVNDLEWTALMIAAWRGHAAVVRLLLHSGADANLTAAPENHTALLLASRAGHIPVCQELIRAGADVNAVDDMYQTPLMKACAFGHAYISEMLLDAGADVARRDLQDGMTALSWAAQIGPSSVVKRLIRAGADVNSTNYNGQTPLLLAASNNGSSDSSAGDDSNPSSAAMAVSVVEELIAAGADVNAKNHDGYTPLMVSAFQGHTAVVAALLRASANVNAKAEHGQTALHLASVRGHAAIVELLLKAGAEHRFLDAQGHSALFKSAMAGHSYITDCLIRAGADTVLKDSEFGRTPLHYACLRMHSAVISILVRGDGREALLNARAHNGDKPLHCAAEQLYPYGVEALLMAGAKCDAKNDRGESALLLAVTRFADKLASKLHTKADDLTARAVSTVRLLLSAGADVHSRNHERRSALLLAAERALPLVSLLVQYGADIQRPDPVTGVSVIDAASTQPELLSAVQHGLRLRDEQTAEETNHHDADEQRQQQHEAEPGEADDDEEEGTRGDSNQHDDSDAKQADNEEDEYEEESMLHMIQHQQRQDSENTARSHQMMLDASMQMQDLVLSPQSSTKSNPRRVMRDVSGRSAASNTSATSGVSTTSFSLATSTLPPFTAQQWGVNEVTAWLDAIGLSQYIAPFADASVDGEMLVVLAKDASQSLLEHEVGVTRKIHRMKIVREINKLIQASSSNSNSSSVVSASSAAVVAAAAATTTTSPADTVRASSSPAVVRTVDYSAKIPSLTELERETQQVVQQRAALEAALAADNNNNDNDDERKAGDVDNNNNQPQQRRMIPKPREIPFGELQLQEQIGRGAFGTVYKATWRGALVAVKKLHKQDLADDELVEFRREAGLMELLGNHPSVVRFCGVCTASPNLCVVTQYLPNGSVHSLLGIPSAHSSSSTKSTKSSSSSSSANEQQDEAKSKIELDMRTIIRMAREAASGVLHLHMEGVVHRDLAARNLLVDSDYSVRVSDFGMSRIKKASVGHTDSNIGPVKWMAPEALVKHEYSEKSDAFSFGVCLWEMLTRSVPYAEMENLEAAMKVAASESFRPALPDDGSAPSALLDLIRECWRHDPGQRPDFRAIVDRLGQILVSQ